MPDDRIRHRYIEPGGCGQNPFVECFNSRLRDELLQTEEFTSLLVAQIVIEGWRIEYNTCRPHGSLDGMPPAAYAASWPERQQPQLRTGGPITGVPSVRVVVSSHIGIRSYGCGDPA